MNPLLQVARYTRDLLGYDEQLIKLGRSGYYRDDYDTGIIAIDSLAPAKVVSRSTFFDADEELQKSLFSYEQVVTLNFYGNDALNNAQKWLGYNSLELGYQLQRIYAVSVYIAGGPADLKSLSENQYTNRYEVTATIRYNVEESLPVYRIDSGTVQGITDNPESTFEVTIEKE